MSSKPARALRTLVGSPGVTGRLAEDRRAKAVFSREPAVKIARGTEDHGAPPTRWTPSPPDVAAAAGRGGNVATPEALLARSAKIYRALMENPTYGICWIDRGGTFLDANQTLAAMLGFRTTADLLLANLATDIMRRPEDQARWADGLKAGRIDRMEVEWACAGGTSIMVRLGGRQMFDEAGVSDGYELIAEDITERCALEAHLRRLVATDALTGLSNYRRFVDVLGAEMERSRRTGRTFAVLTFDLDGLKQINDRDGHLVGNRALRRLADALRLSCRSIDTPARCGGDEFAIVLPETNATAAGLFGRRICDRLVQDAEKPSLTTSVGLAVYPYDGDTVDDLLGRADAVLYAMKGRAGLLLRPPSRARSVSPR